MKESTMPTIKDMCEQRTKLITDAQALVLGEKVTVEQRAQANKMVADVEILEADINTAQRLEKFELESRSSVHSNTTLGPVRSAT
jgi:hypothetical protein